MTARTRVLKHVSAEQSQASHETVLLIKGLQEGSSIPWHVQEISGLFLTATMSWPANTFCRWTDDHILLPKSLKRFTNLLLKRTMLFLSSLCGSSVSAQGELWQVSSRRCGPSVHFSKCNAEPMLLFWLNQGTPESHPYAQERIVSRPRRCLCHGWGVVLSTGMLFCNISGKHKSVQIWRGAWQRAEVVLGVTLFCQQKINNVDITPSEHPF